MNAPISPSIRKAFEFAWITFKANFGLMAACVFTFFGSWVVLEVLVVAGQRLGFIWWLAVHISFFIIFAGLEVGFIRICLSIHNEQQVAYTDIFQALRLGVMYLLVQLVYFGIILIGLVLLIVPGVYYGTRYALYGQVFAEGNASLKQAFRRSAGISQGAMRVIFWLGVTTILLNIAGASFLGVGLFVTVPISAFMKVYIYRHLTN
ncbi:MAG TPA: hypothetical protein VLA72_11705 [Anaerolineales bacterium]|nr:hypothetical protein [Anaerolineales bacterium]